MRPRKCAVWCALAVLLTVAMPAYRAAAQVKVTYGIEKPDYRSVGRAGWQFLKLPTNARFAGMGGITSVVVGGGASTVLGNPASMVKVKNMSASFTSMNWIADVKYYSSSFVKTLGRLGTVGVSLIYVDYGDMTRTANMEVLDAFGQPLGRTKMVLDGLGTFSGGDLAVGVSYARAITDRLQVGGTLRYIQETLDDATTGNIVLDVGTVYYTGIKSFRISMLGRNFGPDASFTSYDERIGVPAVQVPTPMTFSLGGAVDLLEGRSGPHLWTIAAEFVHPNDGNEKLNLGTEYSFMKFVWLRAGYRMFYDEEGLTLGAGINVRTAAMKVSFNYAHIDFGRLNSVQVISMGLEF